ncbi:uncharacterized protein Tco025E_09032 [Trypanosoma conorhini]|uniref:Uncharacterized protein n=1 Tax=Trypanosoma conorhini TaxID=83891 RepID=A0A3R7K2P6_9TRYP|nr:uncharacterized protein Tco025E_09032 [Trypanosoma conorhini]RNF00733.1 hypothetical protein Tco025E_09032 [Trypanosoma conorhini]
MILARPVAAESPQCCQWGVLWHTAAGRIGRRRRSGGERHKGCMPLTESKAHAHNTPNGRAARRARSAARPRRPLVWAPGTRPCSVKCGGRLVACGCRAECQATEQGPAELLPRVPVTSSRRAAAVFSNFLSLLRALETGPTRATDGVLHRGACPRFNFVFCARRRPSHITRRLVELRKKLWG